MTESWKDVVGYEGLYEVSDFGNVRSLLRNNVRNLAFRNHKNGYYTVLLWRDGKQKSYTVHRLVALAFIPNNDGFTDVNHIDENKKNNRVDNLEWCTHKENVQKYNANHLRHGCVRNGKHKGKKIIQLTLNGEFIREWPNSRTVFRETGMSDWSVSQCCRGIWKTAYGFKWRYAN